MENEHSTRIISTIRDVISTSLHLSHNRQKKVPDGLENAKSLLVLNLSDNQIEIIPNSLFIHLTDLLFLDPPQNKLETLPPQTRRLTNLQILNLRDNPLELFQLRQLPSLQNLECLTMRNTHRKPQHFPTALDTFSNIFELDLPQNSLPKTPDCLYNMGNLKRLNLYDNDIADHLRCEFWQNLETLNLAQNKLKSLPASLCKLHKLRRSYT